MGASWTSVAVAGALIVLAAASPADGGAAYETSSQISESHLEELRLSYEVPGASLAIVEKGHGVRIWTSGATGHKPSAPLRADTSFSSPAANHLVAALMVADLVERGLVSLDQPVQRYLPSFRPANRWRSKISVSHLLAHRSGLISRVPTTALGEPSNLEASLSRAHLRFEPGSKAADSASDTAVLFAIAERISGNSVRALVGDFARSRGLKSTRFSSAAGTYGSIHNYDGEPMPAKAEGRDAGDDELVTSVQDMSVIASAAMASSYVRHFGLAPRFDGATVGDLGSNHGVTSAIWIDPSRRKSAVAVATRAGSAALVERLAKGGLGSDDGIQLSALRPAIPVPAALARRLAGYYTDGRRSVMLRWWKQRLFYEGERETAEVRLAGSKFLLDDHATFDDQFELEPIRRRIVHRGITYTRRAWARPALPAPTLGDLIGIYGDDPGQLVVYEQDGELAVQTGGFQQSRLRRVQGDIFEFPHDGIHAGETLRFERNASGSIVGAFLRDSVLPRRDVRAEAEIAIGQGMDDAEASRALAAAQMAQMPNFRSSAVADLVSVKRLVPSMQIRLFYKERTSFSPIPLYPENAELLLQRPVAEALVRAVRSLRAKGYNVEATDGYRPWYVSKFFWDITPAQLRIFVADPSKGSRHNRGSAIDLRLVEMSSGSLASMPGELDEPSRRSYVGYRGGSSRQRWHRDLLREAMERAGFVVYDQEWWHFDHINWATFPILNVQPVPEAQKQQ